MSLSRNAQRTFPDLYRAGVTVGEGEGAVPEVDDGGCSTGTQGGQCLELPTLVITSPAAVTWRLISNNMEGSWRGWRYSVVDQSGDSKDSNLNSVHI